MFYPFLSVITSLLESIKYNVTHIILKKINLVPLKVLPEYAKNSDLVFRRKTVDGNTSLPVVDSRLTKYV